MYRTFSTSSPPGSPDADRYVHHGKRGSQKLHGGESDTLFVEALALFSKAVTMKGEPELGEPFGLPGVALALAIEPSDNAFTASSIAAVVVCRVFRHDFRIGQVKTGARRLTKTLAESELKGERIKKWIVDDLVRAGRPDLALVLAEAMLRRARAKMPLDQEVLSAAAKIVQDVRAASLAQRVKPAAPNYSARSHRQTEWPVSTHPGFVRPTERQNMI